MQMLNLSQSMALIKTEQDGDKKLQATRSKPLYKTLIGMVTFGKIAVHTMDGKIAVPSSLQSVSSTGITPTYTTLESQGP